MKRVGLSILIVFSMNIVQAMENKQSGETFENFQQFLANMSEQEARKAVNNSITDLHKRFPQIPAEKLEELKVVVMNVYSEIKNGVIDSEQKLNDQISDEYRPYILMAKG